ncbi:MAG TPA: glycoside hydrolase family 38 C-terminal domain-containing protein [Terriglobales bacterium]|nr:glycoside hydrolase family 38 C-terminal domain-containing protein [Terriglobales bacterium]
MSGSDEVGVYSPVVLPLKNGFAMTRLAWWHFAPWGFSATTIFALLLPCAIPAPAQSAEEVARTANTLSSQSQTVIERLSSLDTLPVDGWKMHGGDLAHGEAINLDDSSWPIVRAKAEGGTDAVWYRRSITVPTTLDGYDLTGSRIWFSFQADANGPLPEIIYLNGRRVAMGDDLEPIILFDHATPGDTVLAAVKLLPTVDKKIFMGTEQRIEFSESRPNPNDLRVEFLTSAILLPSLSNHVSADTAVLEKAVGAVDLKALDARDQAAFDASLQRAREQMETLRPTLRQASILLAGNAHIDAAWLWPWTETVDVVKRTFGTALQLMNEYPDYTYTQSAAAYSEWIAEKYPQMNEEIKRRIREGRWEIVGGMWVEPDLNLPDGESTARSLLIGKRWFQKEYGVDVHIGWNPDSFGYSWQLPQIYKRSGVDYFVTQKMAWNDTNQLPFKLFWWESPDGSKVLTYFPHDYVNTDLNPVRLARDLVIARGRAPGLTEMMDLFGVGDHGGGPTRAILDEGVHWMQPDKIVPPMRFGTASAYFHDLAGKLDSNSPEWDYTAMAQGYTEPPAASAGRISIPTWKSELYFEYHRGVMTTQANHKRNLRQASTWVLNAEKDASLAWLEGEPYPTDTLTEAWKKVTFNDFHDLAAGSGIGIIYQDAQRDYDQVRWATNEISSKAMAVLAAHVNTSGGTGIPVFVFNPLAWQRSGLVRLEVQMPAALAGSPSVLDPQGRVLPSEVLAHDPTTHSYRLLVNAQNVPSMGYAILHVVPGTNSAVSDLKVRGLSLENAQLRVTVDPKTGCITSLFDKHSRFESLAGGACGNQLQTFKDTPQDYDAWNIDPGTLDHMTPIDTVDSVQLIEEGPLRAVIRVSRSWQSSKFVQDITLYAGADQVEVVNDIDWHETHVLLKAAFPLAATSNRATYEIPFGSIARPTTRNNPWEKAQFEVPAQYWADLSDGQHGFSLLNESKFAYDDQDNVLRLTLLRSPVWPDPTADRGHHHFGYALYPHAGDWKQALTVRHGYEYNYPLQTMLVAAHSGRLPPEYSFASIQPENVVLTAMKKAEDSTSLILHAYEWAGRSSNLTFKVPKGATGAVLTNLLEQPQGSWLTISGDQLTVPIHPFEILSLRVDYAPDLKQGQRLQ